MTMARRTACSALSVPFDRMGLGGSETSKQATVERTITQRGIRVYLDYSQNLAEGNTGGGA
jgi:hypothetical protein